LKLKVKKYSNFEALLLVTISAQVLKPHCLLTTVRVRYQREKEREKERGNLNLMVSSMRGTQTQLEIHFKRSSVTIFIFKKYPK